MEVKPLIYAMENIWASLIIFPNKLHGIVKGDNYIQRIGDRFPR